MENSKRNDKNIVLFQYKVIFRNVLNFNSYCCGTLRKETLYGNKTIFLELIVIVWSLVCNF